MEVGRVTPSPEIPVSLGLGGQVWGSGSSESACRGSSNHLQASGSSVFHLQELWGWGKKVPGEVLKNMSPAVALPFHLVVGEPVAWASVPGGVPSTLLSFDLL